MIEPWGGLQLQQCDGFISGGAELLDPKHDTTGGIMIQFLAVEVCNL